MPQGVPIKGEEIVRTLATAHETAKQGPTAELTEKLAPWMTRIADLGGEAYPRTYMAVLAILLTARSMHEADILDVRDIKTSTSDYGYSASSIGAKVSAFAKDHRIDLRANSSQPMNNQPFTFKNRILIDMGVQSKYADQWGVFYDTVLQVQELTSEQARSVLALLFMLRRRIDAPTIAVVVKTSDKSTLDKVSAAVAQYVYENSDNGKIGQAFVAALFDLLYTPDEVILGDTQDPDASAPGDVQVGAGEDGVWLWAEAKQKIITTGDVTGFLRKVRDAGGERVVYFALINSSYSGSVRMEAVAKESDRLGMGVHMIDSPTAALDWMLPLAPGSYGRVASTLLERLHARMTQSGCAPKHLASLGDLAKRFAYVA